MPPPPPPSNHPHQDPAGAGGVEPVAWLIPVAGPPMPAVRLAATPGGMVIGRAADCAIRLPADADKVSRNHCRVGFVDSVWRICDLKSKWGTTLNGQPLPPHLELPLKEGDLLRVAPWTFTFSLTEPQTRGVMAADDTGTAQIDSVDPARQRQALDDDLVTLLLQSAEAIHAATSEAMLAAALVDVAVRGTSLPNCAVLKPVDASGRVDVLASRTGGMETGPGGGAISYSRSLLARAATGQVAELRADAAGGVGGGDTSASILQMKITSAVCAPLVLGQTVAGYLYLDARVGAMGSTPAAPRHNAAAFVMALARMGSLALASLKRFDVERRTAEMSAEIATAALAQRLILPARSGAAGAFRYDGESRPGQSLGGDFFEAMEVSPSRFAVALGDVTGKGIPASVLMTASYGFLHAHLSSAAFRDNPDPAAVVRALSRFLHPRRDASRFVTLWLGVFDVDAQTLTYVDAGHGYGLLVTPDNTIVSLDEGGGPPAGIYDDFAYTPVTVPMAPQSRCVVVSDGLVEQFGVGVDERGQAIKRQFDLDNIRETLRRCGPGDDLKGLFDAVTNFAGTPQLTDDATAVIVRW